MTKTQYDLRTNLGRKAKHWGNDDDLGFAYPDCAHQPKHAGARGDDVKDEGPECAVLFCAGESGGEGKEGVCEECEGWEDDR